MMLMMIVVVMLPLALASASTAPATTAPCLGGHGPEQPLDFGVEEMRMALKVPADMIGQLTNTHRPIGRVHPLTIPLIFIELHQQRNEP